MAFVHPTNYRFYIQKYPQEGGIEHKAFFEKHIDSNDLKVEESYLLAFKYKSATDASVGLYLTAATSAYEQKELVHTQLLLSSNDWKAMVIPFSVKSLPTDNFQLELIANPVQDAAAGSTLGIRYISIYKAPKCNLFCNAKNNTGWGNTEGEYITSSVNTIDGFSVARFDVNKISQYRTNSPAEISSLLIDGKKDTFIYGRKYTVSFEYRTGGKLDSFGFNMQYTIPNESHGIDVMPQKIFPASGDWTRAAVTFPYLTYSDNIDRLYFEIWIKGVAINDYVEVRKFTVVEGDYEDYIPNILDNSARAWTCNVSNSTYISANYDSATKTMTAKVIKSHPAVYPALDLESSFDCRYMQSNILTSVGDIKNIYKESFIEASGEKLWMPSKENIAHSSVPCMLKVRFRDGDVEFRARKLYEYLKGSKIEYSDTFRNMMASVIIEKSPDIEFEKKREDSSYLVVSYPLTNFLGYTYEQSKL